MTASEQGSTYFRKGFGLKGEVEETLAADYDGSLVDLLRLRDHTLTVGDMTVRLARELGFCYGVERAVEYAYQTRRKFPDRRILLVGEIIHNPHVNRRLGEMGIEILQPGYDAHGKPVFDYARVSPSDVVILPAFGVTVRDFETLRGLRRRAPRGERRATPPGAAASRGCGREEPSRGRRHSTGRRWRPERARGSAP